MTIFEKYFYLINGLIGMFLNLIVLLIAYLNININNKPSQLIVINMTLADLLTCTIYMITRSYVNIFPQLFCYPYYILVVSSQLCSCLNLLWINLDKFLFIKFPLHYYTLVNKKRIILLMILSWILIFGLVSFLYWFMEIKNSCDKVILSGHIYLFICLLYIISLINSLIFSIIIFYIAQKSKHSKSSKEFQLFKRLFFVFSSTLWTFCTCLPYRLLYLGVLLSILKLPSLLIKTTINIFYFILVLGIVFNPIITIFTQKIYRNCLINYLINIFGKKKITTISINKNCQNKENLNFIKENFEKNKKENLFINK
ncbi:hypothetical protein Mgra_00003137 [Meloidogyne graminicola]|uniref:G-protein coupled receptors family 1 profile domain-containing protein n=1 Tax=Meloidogyne graminicola TaxID=189291 RepID=A0A8S9ZUL5_9BILA|nr:hypothetical protein Mgra_00003137 [Meloidogyne graminicola]